MKNTIITIYLLGIFAIPSKSWICKYNPNNNVCKKSYTYEQRVAMNNSEWRLNYDREMNK